MELKFYVPFARTHHLDLTMLGLLTLDFAEQAAPFSAAEVAAAVRDTPAGRVPGPDGPNATFYKAAWAIVGLDIIRVFRALWEMDFRSFHHLNEAVMVLLHKTQAPTRLKDYRPISLIHSVAKLFSKCLAMRLALRMHELVRANQSAFIRGRQIHENFKMV